MNVEHRPKQAPGGSPFGALLRQFRVAAGLSQEALAERARMSIDGISALERGINRAPQRETLALLVQALGLDDEQQRAIEASAERPTRPRLSARSADKRNNLPATISQLYGRQRELGEISSLVRRLPLVTLTGTGGVGKTRLAVQVGVDSLPHFSDGVWFVDLAPVRDPQLVAADAAAIFSVKESADRPLVASLADALRAKNVLLILDNCEHLAPAAAALIEALAQAGPLVRTLATSRQPLNVPGEQAYRVASLSVPDEAFDVNVERAREYSAIALFEDRAKRVDAAFALTDENVGIVARICRRLDGIALAIELAAARLATLGPQQLENLLSERFRVLAGGGQSALPRHRTMRALIDWSYELLSTNEQRLFARLGVFAGSFSLEAASAIGRDDATDEWEIIELLASLVQKSLVVSEPHGTVQRYHLLESISAYAWEHAAAEHARLNRKHAEFYVALAERAEADYAAASSSADWATQLEPELEDVRVALDWAFGAGRDVTLGARLLTALLDFWLQRGLVAEAARRAEAGLDEAADLPAPLRAALWMTLASMRGDLFAPAPALEAATRARELYAALGDDLGVARALGHEGIAHVRLGQLAEAEGALQQSLALSRASGRPRDITRSVASVAVLLQVRGRLEDARAAMLEVLDTVQASSDERLRAVTTLNLAETEFALGDVGNAVERAYENFASDGLRDNLRLRSNQGGNLSAYLFALGIEDEARAAALSALNDARASGDYGMVAVTLQHLAATMSRQDARRAARILGYVERVFGETGYKRERTERLTYDPLVTTLHETLSDAEIAALAEQGAAMTEDQAVKLALSSSYD